MDGVVAISHLGASTEEAEDNCAAMAASQVVDFIENGNIINSVNYPRIDLGKKEETRVVVLFEGDHVEEVLKLNEDTLVTRYTASSTLYTFIWTTTYIRK